MALFDMLRVHRQKAGECIPAAKAVVLVVSLCLDSRLQSLSVAFKSDLPTPCNQLHVGFIDVLRRNFTRQLFSNTRVDQVDGE
ncbi:hypothetical protein CQ13_39440 [Bradyrhizobium retamae]|uniref:Uncharacterized protein n=1 Tax=Bradyrhizobium retamae TaxID=1300035 RepID=A0A0R3NF19_9BRAD|nr:hypothetical protein CQ13_39440 [Bradyrhizobium retamae]